MQLKNVPAIRVIRREVGAPRQSALAGYALGLAALAALLVWQAGDIKLGATVFFGFSAAFLLFWLASLGALRLFAALGRAGSVSWRYGLANLRRRSRANAVQIVALALGLTVLLPVSAATCYPGAPSCRKTRPIASSSISSRSRCGRWHSFSRKTGSRRRPAFRWCGRG